MLWFYFNICNATPWRWHTIWIRPICIKILCLFGSEINTRQSELVWGWSLPASKPECPVQYCLCVSSQRKSGKWPRAEKWFCCPLLLPLEKERRKSMSCFRVTADGWVPVWYQGTGGTISQLWVFGFNYKQKALSVLLFSHLPPLFFLRCCKVHVIAV